MLTHTEASTSGRIAANLVWGKMLRGGAWLFALRVVERGLGIARIAILARVLTPHDFGIMAIALLAMTFMRQFSETGVRQALIQKKDDIRSYLGTAWTVNFLRDLMLASLMAGSAPLVAGFFDAPAARPILQVIALSWLLSGLRNIGLVYLRKELVFNRFVAYHFAIMLTELAVSISAAIILRSVWALVLGLLISNLVGLVLSYIVAPRPDRIDFDLRKARELLQFGRWVFGSQALIVLFTQLDKIVVGRLISVGTLGLYHMAYNLSTMTSQELVNIVTRVAFPGYAQLQHQVDTVRDAYLKVIQIASLVAMPVAVGTVLLADPLVRHILGEQWVEMVPALQVLAVWGFIQSISHAGFALCAGLGRPELPTRVHAVRLLMLAALFFPFTRTWGMVGTAGAVALSAALVDPVLWVMALRLVRASIWDMLRALGPALVGSVAVVGAVTLLIRTLLEPTDLTRLVAVVTAGFVAYLVGLAFSVGALRWRPKELVDLQDARGVRTESSTAPDTEGVRI